MSEDIDIVTESRSTFQYLYQSTCSSHLMASEVSLLNEVAVYPVHFQIEESILKGKLMPIWFLSCFFVGMGELCNRLLFAPWLALQTRTQLDPREFTLLQDGQGAGMAVGVWKPPIIDRPEDHRKSVENLACHVPVILVFGQLNRKIWSVRPACAT